MVFAAIISSPKKIPIKALHLRQLYANNINIKLNIMLSTQYYFILIGNVAMLALIWQNDH